VKYVKLTVLVAIFVVLIASLSCAALKAGTPAPDFSLMTTTDDTITLSDYRGQIVILHFWKSN